MIKRIRFLADENIPLEVVEELQKAGIDLNSVSLEKPGISDENVLILAEQQRRVLITFDRDFGELIIKTRKQSWGVIFLRIHPQTVGYIVEILKKVLALNLDFPNLFCVVEPHRVRAIHLKLNKTPAKNL